jgi:acyl-CoA dehydrogenase
MYQAPVEDMKFALRYLVGLDRVAAISGMDMVSEDLVDAVLEEAGKLAGRCSGTAQSRWGHGRFTPQ